MALQHNTLDNIIISVTVLHIVLRINSPVRVTAHCWHTSSGAAHNNYKVHRTNGLARLVARLSHTVQLTLNRVVVM